MRVSVQECGTWESQENAWNACGLPGSELICSRTGVRGRSEGVYEKFIYGIVGVTINVWL